MGVSKRSIAIMLIIDAIVAASVVLVVRSHRSRKDPSPWLVISTIGGPVYGRFSKSPCKLNKLVPDGARLAQLTDIRTVPNPGPDGMFRAVPQPDACLSLSAIVSVSTVDPKTPLGKILDAAGPMTAAQLGVRLPAPRVALPDVPTNAPPNAAANKGSLVRKK